MTRAGPADFADRAGPAETRPLGPIAPAGAPGVSLVTCSMNRAGNLLKALPSWLRHREIDEIVVVDWSSDDPVAEALSAAGLTDPRIRVLRVEDEPRWILSLAFNAGFRVARRARILKADADIVLSEGFFDANVLADDDDRFIAGDWRAAEAGQEHVNGFFYAPRAALAAVNGFNEDIVTYGWDDDDLYDRLVLAGVARAGVAPGCVRHLPHGDEERLGRSLAEGPRTLRDEIADDPMLSIQANRILAGIRPRWGGGGRLQPFDLAAGGEPSGRRTLVARRVPVPERVPAHQRAAALALATGELAAWRLGARARHVPPERIGALIDRPADTVSRLDVEVAVVRPEAVAPPGARYAVIETGEAPARNAAVLAAIVERVRAAGFAPVLSAPAPAAQEMMQETPPGALREVPAIPAGAEIGALPRVDLARLRAGDTPAEAHLRVIPGALPTAAGVASGRRRLFIDAQHGLGNRLRAIGSAAAVAEATDRELVIVWQPDHHCEARFADLFDHDGAVIEESFADAARDAGCAVHSYMEIEPGAEKDAPIDAAAPCDLYCRSAYVLKATGAGWAPENRFLRGLRPTATVRALCAFVRAPNDVSVHVRMASGAGYDHLAWESADNWTREGHEITEGWRRKSHYSRFIARLDALIAEGRAERVFVAADTPEAYEAFVSTYGRRIAYLPRTAWDRSAAQLQCALADALLLSRSPLLLGSTWSSFTELASRLAPGGMTIEMSGRDF